MLQSFIVLLGPDNSPASPIFYKYFSVLKRFTHVCFIYALFRAIMYIIVSFGLIYLIESFGNGALLLIVLPITLGYFLGLRYFENLEQKSGDYA
jgi:hypothetical protein